MNTPPALLMGYSTLYLSNRTHLCCMVVQQTGHFTIILQVADLIPGCLLSYSKPMYTLYTHVPLFTNWYTVTSGSAKGGDAVMLVRTSESNDNVQLVCD